MRVPSHNSIKTHHGVGSENELRIGTLSRASCLLTIQLDFRLIIDTFGLQIVLIILLELVHLHHRAFDLSWKILFLELILVGYSKGLWVDFLLFVPV